MNIFCKTHSCLSETYCKFILDFTVSIYCQHNYSTHVWLDTSWKHDSAYHSRDNGIIQMQLSVVTEKQTLENEITEVS